MLIQDLTGAGVKFETTVCYSLGMLHPFCLSRNVATSCNESNLFPAGAVIV
jgi:hypothetical protein